MVKAMNFLLEIDWRGVAHYAIGAAVIAVILAGCSRTIEGAGFENTGRPSRPACVERDNRGNERWFTC